MDNQTPFTYDTEQALNENKYTKTGYLFDGWNTEKYGTGTGYADKASVLNLTADNEATVTLYAQWIIDTYTVTFNSNGGSSVSSKYVDYDYTFTKPTDPTKTGYIFAGWYKDSSLKNAWNFKTDTVTDYTTLYAKWTPITYTVTFNSNSGSSVSSASVNYSNTLTKPTDPTREGYTFAGWYKDSSLTTAWDFSTDKVTANTTLYAKWTSVEKKLVEGWNKVDDVWYLADKDGNKLTGWQKVNNTWYYLNEDGVMQTGWLKENNTWYYLNTSGSMKTGWLKDNGVWYYLNSNGSMKTGWLKSNNNWYYLNTNGSMKTGWVKSNNIWYYLNNSGAMATNTWINNYHVNSNGAWDKTK